jgi:starch phosphorylase
MSLKPSKSVPLVAPSPVQRLPEIAYNLWWSWHPETQELFSAIDAAHWEAHRNPVKLLRDRQNQLRDLAQDASFVAAYRKVLNAYERYMKARTWFSQHHRDYAETPVAYFSAEFGLHECLPIYSGGLGILAGDHTKSASDLGVPFIGVGLLYKHGYFQQRLDEDGQQVAKYPNHDFRELPILPAQDQRGRPLSVSVDLPGRKVSARVWEVKVGRARLLLLDADVPENSRSDRAITSQLYGGDRDTRISQEIILGIGGVRAIRSLGIKPGVWHLNEGHVAFSCFERLRERMVDDQLDFVHAVEAVAAKTVFTTHTPVAAGNEAFSLPLMDKYFRGFCDELDIDLASLLNLGLQTGERGEKFFSMTVAALKLSSTSNGVSELHGEVSRKMWGGLWPRVPEPEAPITHVTNGIHVETWLAPEMAELFDRHLGADWRSHLADASFWQRVEKIPNEELWRVHQQLKTQLVEFTRKRLVSQLKRHGASEKKITEAQTALDPNLLTIGFARRFTPYKRADLIFTDLKRLEKIVSNTKKPLQIIYAGKAHPQDLGGQAILKRIHNMIQRPGIRGKIVFIEDYDMNVGRHLVRGVDVWLNNPRRPLEASGTSGQKAPINGGINCSVLDGWWCEGYNGKNGWKIGEPIEFASEAQQDLSDARDLYRVLEKEVLPLYYKKKGDLPEDWVNVMKASLGSLTPVFNTETMLRNYVQRLYLPTWRRGSLLQEGRFTTAAQVAEIKEWIRENWPLVHVTHAEAVSKRGSLSLPKSRSLSQSKSGDEIHVDASVYLGQLPPDVVQVELYCTAEKNSSKMPKAKAIPLKMISSNGDGVSHYRLTAATPFNGSSQYHLRVLPKAPASAHKHELGLIHWWKLEEKISKQ